MTQPNKPAETPVAAPVEAKPVTVEESVTLTDVGLTLTNTDRDNAGDAFEEQYGKGVGVKLANVKCTGYTFHIGREAVYTFTADVVGKS